MRGRDLTAGGHDEGIRSSRPGLPSLDEWESGARGNERHKDDLLELDSITRSLSFSD
jgi:hypothetical protein